MQRLFLSFLLALSLSQAWACADHDVPDVGASVPVTEASVSTTQNAGHVLVTVLGTLKNTTGNRIDSVVLEAKLTDSSGKVIDVLTDRDYGLVVPAGQEAAFRLQAQAAASPNAYAGVQARVVSAEAHPQSTNPRPAKKEPSLFMNFLLSWGPMILLVGVFIFMTRKYSGKGSFQDKMLVAIHEQNELLTKQVAAIEGVASAANAKKPGTDH